MRGGLLAVACSLAGLLVHSTLAQRQDPVLYTCDELTPQLCRLRVKEGDLQVKGLRLHYWLYSSEDSSATQKLPLITAHGGPSWTHNYLLPLKQQACRGREVLFYDQVGCGRSERVSPRQYPWLLDPQYYATVEIYAVIKHMQEHEGWGQRYHFLGHSWGTMLGQLFALSKPAGLQSLVLGGPLSDAKLYFKAQFADPDGTVGSLPPFLRQRVSMLDSAGMYNSSEYQLLDAMMTTAFTVRTYPAPDCFVASQGSANVEIYVGMQGASEFTIGGRLKDFNLTGELHAVEAPVLLTSGRYDTMRPPVVKTMLHAFPNARWVQFPHSGHCTMIDDPGLMNDAVAEFLDQVESGMTVQQHALLEDGVSRAATEAMMVMNRGVATEGAMLLTAVALVAGATGFLLGSWRRERCFERRERSEAPGYERLPPGC